MVARHDKNSRLEAGYHTRSPAPNKNEIAADQFMSAWLPLESIKSYGIAWPCGRREVWSQWRLHARLWLNDVDAISRVVFVVNRTPHTSHYPAFVRTHHNVARYVRSMCSAHRVIHVSCGCASWFSSTLHCVLFTSLHSLIHLPFHSPDLHLHLLSWREKCLVRFLGWGAGHFGQQHPCHRLWAQRPRQFPHLGDHWILHPTTLRRQQALEFAWLTRRWLHHRENALFTTAHSGARRNSGRRQAYHSSDEILLSSPSLSVGHIRTSRSLISKVRENPCRDSEMSKSGFFWGYKKSRFSPVAEQRLRNTSSKPIMTRNIQKLNGVIESQRGENNHALARDEQQRRDQQLQGQLSEQNRELRETHEKSLNELEELKRFRYNFKEKIGRRSKYYLDIIGKIQELQIEIN